MKKELEKTLWIMLRRKIGTEEILICFGDIPIELSNKTNPQIGFESQARVISAVNSMNEQYGKKYIYWGERLQDIDPNKYPNYNDNPYGG